MFGKNVGPPAPRKPDPAAEKPTAPPPRLKVVEAPAPASAQPEAAPTPSEPPKKAKAQPKATTGKPDQRLEEIKIKVFNDLLTAVDLSALTKLDPDAVREEIGDAGLLASDLLGRVPVVLKDLRA